MPCSEGKFQIRRIERSLKDGISWDFPVSHLTLGANAYVSRHLGIGIIYGLLDAQIGQSILSENGPTKWDDSAFRTGNFYWTAGYSKYF